MRECSRLEWGTGATWVGKVNAESRRATDTSPRGTVPARSTSSDTRSPRKPGLRVLSNPLRPGTGRAPYFGKPGL